MPGWGFPARPVYSGFGEQWGARRLRARIATGFRGMGREPENQSGTKGIPPMKNQFRVKRLAGALAVLLATAPVYAQNTSANLAGRVTAADGAPLTGAQVTIVHTPSGT